MAKSPPDNQLTIVVATRNRREDLMRTLPRHEAPVILVDNGSTDDTVLFVRERHPDVHVIPLGRNRGAAARNVGVFRSRSPYVAFADDDSYWEPGSLGKAVALLDQYDRAALLCARVLVGEEGRLDAVSAQMMAAPLGWAADLPGPSILGFMSCAVVVRRSVFLEVGGFAELLHVYGEEQLLSLDLAAAGWGLAYVDDIVVRHLPSQRRGSSSARRRMEARNRLLTAWLRRPAGGVREVTGTSLRRAVADADERAALLSAVRHLPTVVRQRRPIPAELERNVRRLASARA
jgi:N-acetylglucosaminyl-diphospho-decaprenol L-rhamnosyltransferase